MHDEGKGEVMEKQGELFAKAARYAVSMTRGLNPGELQFPCQVDRDESEHLLEILTDAGVLRKDGQIKQWHPAMTTQELEEFLASQQAGATEPEAADSEQGDATGVDEQAHRHNSDDEAVEDDTVELRLEQIQVRDDLRVREKISSTLVKEYAAAIRSGEELPAVTVFQSGEDFWLTDGSHRYAAAEQAGKHIIKCVVRRGNYMEALAHAAGANRRHGLRMSRADKQRAIGLLLLCEEHRDESDRVLADIAGVDHKTVAKRRSEMVTSGEIPQSEERTGRDGRKLRNPKARNRQGVPAKWVQQIPKRVEKLRDEKWADIEKMSPEQRRQINLEVTRAVESLEQLHSDIHNIETATDAAA